MGGLFVSERISRAKPADIEARHGGPSTMGLIVAYKSMAERVQWFVDEIDDANDSFARIGIHDSPTLRMSQPKTLATMTPLQMLQTLTARATLHESAAHVLRGVVGGAPAKNLVAAQALLHVVRKTFELYDTASVAPGQILALLDDEAVRMRRYAGLSDDQWGRDKWQFAADDLADAAVEVTREAYGGLLELLPTQPTAREIKAAFYARRAAEDIRAGIFPTDCDGFAK